MKRRRIHDYEHEGPDVIPPGGSVHVPAFLMDHGGRRRRVSVGDALADHMRFASHRPGYVQDALAYSTRIPRRLADAIEAKERAYRLRDQRGDNAWKTPLNQTSPASYDQRDPLPPDDDPNGNRNDDDDDGDEDHDDENALARAQQARDDAYEARRIRGDNAWRDMGGTLAANTPVGNLSGNGGTLDPREADRVEAIRRKTVLR
jgi:hypothetical protein